VVACALAARAVQLGKRVGAMKPIESGADARVSSAGGVPSDAERLRMAAGGDLPMELVRPYLLEEPLAPMVAARRAGVTIEMSTLDAAFAGVEASKDIVLVEGAGGLLVPITVRLSFLDLFAHWRCELIIVAGNRLGVINHVLLTVRAAESAGVPVRAVILTSFSSPDATLAEATNYDALTAVLPAHALFRFPWVDRSNDLDALAAAAEGAGLDVLLESDPPLPTVPGTLFLD
jgi:dethiobiotin synthetase